MTHSELCIEACRWLRKRNAKHAFAEFQTMTLSEFPDAIGFPAGTWRGPTVVEVKVSIEDFRRDKHKGWRHREKAQIGECGMGAWRYYLVPDGMVGADGVPGDHGLLYASKRGSRMRIVEAKKAPLRERRDVGSEMAILCSALQRWELGIPWVAEEFRFATREEMDRMTNPRRKRETP